MSEFWSGLIGAALGAVLSGAASIIVTKLSLSGERKRQEESDKRMFRLKNAQDDRKAKITLYVGLLNIIANIGIFIGSDELKNEVEYPLIDNSTYQKFSQNLNDFYRKNIGLIDLYVPTDIVNKLAHLREKLYILSENQTTTTLSDTPEELQHKLESLDLKKFMLDVVNLREAICKDINKDSLI